MRGRSRAASTGRPARGRSATFETAQSPPCFGYYHDTDLIECRPAGVPLHCLSADANPATGLILGYSEYFGFHRFVCLLGQGYRGPAIQNTYAIDPRTGAELDLRVHIPFSRKDIEDIYAYRRTKLEDLKRAADAILGPAMQARMDAERKRVVSQAIDEAFASCGAKPGEALTPEQVQKLALVAAQKVAPFVLYQMRGLPPDVVAAIQSASSAGSAFPKQHAPVACGDGGVNRRRILTLPRFAEIIDCEGAFCRDAWVKIGR